MSLATMRRLRVAIYAYSSVMDADTGVSESVYTKLESPDSDGLWWASRGTLSGRELMPTTLPQDQQKLLLSFHAEVPIEPDMVVTEGTKVYRVESVMVRDYGRAAKQVYCSYVDKNDPDYNLVTA
jgi:hypothetical protein